MEREEEAGAQAREAAAAATYGAVFPVATGEEPIAYAYATAELDGERCWEMREPQPAGFLPITEVVFGAIRAACPEQVARCTAAAAWVRGSIATPAAWAPPYNRVVAGYQVRHWGDKAALARVEARKGAVA